MREPSQEEVQQLAKFLKADEETDALMQGALVMNDLRGARMILLRHIDTQIRKKELNRAIACFYYLQLGFSPQESAVIRMTQYQPRFEVGVRLQADG